MNSFVAVLFWINASGCRLRYWTALLERQGFELEALRESARLAGDVESETDPRLGEIGSTEFVNRYERHFEVFFFYEISESLVDGEQFKSEKQ